MAKRFVPIEKGEELQKLRIANNDSKLFGVRDTETNTTPFTGKLRDCRAEAKRLNAAENPSA